MTINLSNEGAVDKDVVQYAHERWQYIATEAGVSLQGFDANAPLLERIAWALRTRWSAIAGMLASLGGS